MNYLIEKFKALGVGERLMVLITFFCVVTAISTIAIVVFPPTTMGGILMCSMGIAFFVTALFWFIFRVLEHS